MLQGGPGAGKDGVMVKSMEEDAQGEVNAGGDMARQAVLDSCQPELAPERRNQHH